MDTTCKVMLSLMISRPNWRRSGQLVEGS